MQRWGRTAAGKPRYRCPNCAQSTTWKRLDNKPRWFLTFLKHLIGTTPLVDLARSHKIQPRTLMRALEPYWLVVPLPLRQIFSEIVIVDGTYLNGRTHAVLIARSKSSVLSWRFVLRENEIAWITLFSSLLKPPKVIVCDGQKGLIKAIHTRWKEVRIQRCLKHIKQGVLNQLSTHPKTRAGQELYQLSKSLTKVWTRRQKRRWLRKFHRWERKYLTFLNEKSSGIFPSGRKHSWYTHKRLRRAYSIFQGALPDLFTFVGHYEIPRTSNHVEGGINSRLKELLHAHRGLPLWKKQVLTAYFLRTKQG